MTNSPTSLPSAILSFAFTGVLGPHSKNGESAPRVVSTPPRVILKPAK